MRFGLNLFLSSALLLGITAIVKAGSFYAYTCYDCDCDAFQALGSGIENNCVNLQQGAAAIGISGNGGKTSCKLFSQPNCGGSSQSNGVHPSQTWGCTNSQIGWVQSMICFGNGNLWW